MKTDNIVTQFLSVICFSLFLSTNVQAQEITQPIETLDIKAQADFLQGDKNKPAILILHGFLTTNKFHTVVAMSQGLNAEGYTVLSPTLTLNINQRNSSIKCNSVHTHTLEHDIMEVKDWIDWLFQKGHKNIILVGHSSGSLELLEYLNVYHDQRIKAAIFTSTFYLKGEELGTSQEDISLAEKLLQENPKKPHKYSFLFCKNNYFATPESFLSYLKLDRKHILDSIRKLDIPSYSIMGKADKRYQSVGENWLSELESTGTKLIIIDGANHFFSSEHEFDLQDELISIMHQLSN